MDKLYIAIKRKTNNKNDFHFTYEAEIEGTKPFIDKVEKLLNKIILKLKAKK